MKADMTAAEWREAVGLDPTPHHIAVNREKRRRNKYGNNPTRYDSPMCGIRVYDSKAEANRARDLDRLVGAGEITSWWPQWPADTGIENDDGSPVVMRLDFRIMWADGRVTYEDVKGMKPTEAWELRRKAVERLHGIKIEIIRRKESK